MKRTTIRKGTFALAFAAAAATSITGPAPARADTVWRWTGSSWCALDTTVPGTDVYVCWQPYGEHIYVCDNRWDGHHVFADFTQAGRPTFRIQNYAGQASCEHRNLDLPEGTRVAIRGCVAEGTRTLSCTRTLYFAA